MNILVTASNSYYKDALKLNVKYAKKYGKFDKVVVYDVDSDIDDEFKHVNSRILNIKRGAGLWLWKVYFIHKALLEECKEGDVLFYLDAAAFFFRPVNNIIECMHDDIFCCQLPYTEETYTKREAFDAIGVDFEKYKDTNQYQCSFMAVKCNKRGVGFVKEWLSFACRFDVICPYFESSLQSSIFHDHRMDQSIFSLLCKKYGIISNQDPSFQGRRGYPVYNGIKYIKIEDSNEYPTCIFVHRFRTNIFINIIMHELQYPIRKLIYVYRKIRNGKN